MTTPTTRSEDSVLAALPALRHGRDETGEGYTDPESVHDRLVAAEAALREAIRLDDKALEQASRLMYPPDGNTEALRLWRETRDKELIRAAGGGAPMAEPCKRCHGNGIEPPTSGDLLRAVESAVACIETWPEWLRGPKRDGVAPGAHGSGVVSYGGAEADGEC